MRSTLLTLMAVALTAWFLGTVTAILLYVSLMTVVTASLILLASLVMFGFGAQAGKRRGKLHSQKASSKGELLPANFAS